ncbi:hypothetical protein J3R83DRAFT_3881 [Lanmaoa asiatica]|nr:hypothetical protein J3R83DRAFT_3881 [Lanmaoa asiatica]
MFYRSFFYVLVAGGNGYSSLWNLRDSHLFVDFIQGLVDNADLVMCERTLTEMIALSKLKVRLEINTVYFTRSIIRSRIEKWEDAPHDAEMVTFMFSLIISACSGNYEGAMQAFDLAGAEDVSFLLLIKAVLVFLVGLHNPIVSPVEDLRKLEPDELLHRLVLAHILVLLAEAAVDDDDYDHAIDLLTRAGGPGPFREDLRWKDLAMVRKMVVLEPTAPQQRQRLKLQSEGAQVIYSTISPTIMHSLQLESSDAEQISNLWSLRSNGEGSSPSTTTVRNRQQGDIDSVFRDDALVSSGFTTWRERDITLSPSPPPQLESVQSTHVQPQMQETDTTPIDPRIASLKAIFPDFDDAVILSVLESTNNDHDRALDVLLGMNDPSFVPPTLPPSQLPNQFQPAPSSDAQHLSQEALDEQLARRLALEEQQAATQSWPPQGVEGQTMYQAYQPRRGGRNDLGGQPQGQPQTQVQGGRDTMGEFQEGFSRFAESGKKTFSSIVSKVRAKMQEFDQGQGWSGSQNPPPEQLPRPAPASYYPSYAPGQQQGSGQGTYTQPYQFTTQPANQQRQTSQSRPARTSTYQSSPPRSGVLRSAPAEPAQSAVPQQSSYYDPNTQGYDLYGDDEEIQIIDRTTPSATASITAQSPATPPHTDSPATPPPPSDTSPSPSYASSVSPPSNARLSSASPPARSLTPTISGAKSTTPGTPGGVDFSKLGLLPKRPISLVRPQSPPVTGAGASAAGANASAPRVAIAHSESTTASSTDKEEPEFVENPFEDQT